MTVEVLIHAGAAEIRAGVVADGKLQELSFERTIGAEDGARGCHSLIGDIVLGRVQRVMAGMQAAFVDFGQERAGFLALRDARVLSTKPDGDIGDCLSEGDAVLVQVIKDPIGEKGARLSVGVTLPGRLLVMTPHQAGIMLSRRIAEESQRAALMVLGEALVARTGSGTGFIIRAAALGASLKELTQDSQALAESWRGIEEKRKTARPPATLHHDLGAIERTLRDSVRGDVARVVLDDAAAAQTARAYCRKAMPYAEALIEVCDQSVFARYGLEDEIVALCLPRVTLASGAWITIQTTEALTAIDVNSGRFAGSSGLEQTSHAVNLEAAGEIGRQIRLRGIGGLIVVDFIHMTEPLHVAEILTALEKSLSFDRAPVQISAMGEFGIVAITRKRVREPLAHGVTCAACGGAGRTPSVRKAWRMTVLDPPGGARSPRPRRGGKFWPRRRRRWQPG